MGVSFWARVLLLAASRLTPLAAWAENPCAARPTQSGWRIFVDRKHRFCFEYPAQYQVAPAVVASGVSSWPGTEFLGRLTTKPGPAQLSLASDETAATIAVYAHGVPFRPAVLTRFAPSGMGGNSPTLIHAAQAEFYYYGPGGEAWTIRTLITLAYEVVRSRSTSSGLIPATKLQPR
jgi:hypothetical protein